MKSTESLIVKITFSMISARHHSPSAENRLAVKYSILGGTKVL